MTDRTIPALSLRDIIRTYPQGSRTLEVFAGVSIDVYPGEIVALVGPSGSGKSSLLHIAGLMEKADAGSIAIGGTDCGTLGDRARTRIRRHEIGFVYQFHHLLGEFSALENVMLPQLIAGHGRRAAKERARQLLDQVGLGERLNHRPAELSGGEQQRVAIVRGLANRPGLLLADEPTGNLDPQTAERVFAVLLDVVRREGQAALIATHNRDLAAAMDRFVELSNGVLVEHRRR